MGNVILRIFRTLLNAITPELRNALRGFVANLRSAASETPSDLDDLFVEVVEAILGIDKEG